ncbi:MAG TPA: substrate-binding domain-containing protein, partial [Anaerolineae bacterium]|nr:substrate-binding domain-containing protein [Anaerolineae bacterium]
MASAVTIGLLAPLLFHKGGAHDFFSKFFASLRTTVQRHGLRLLVVQKPYDSHQCIPVSQSVDGWLVLADATGVEHLHQTGKPIVLVSACSPELGLPAVSVDNEAGMRAAVTHLIEHGHTRIAFVGHHAISESQQRYEAYAATLPGWGLALDPQLVISFEREAQVSRTGDLASMGRLACRQLLERQAPFTAVVCASDDLALGVLQGLQAAGLRVPEDVAVTGFDDSEAAQYARPALTSVHQDFAALAEASVARLLAAIQDRKQVFPKNLVSMAQTLVPASLTVRRSCGCDPTLHAATLFEDSDADEYTRGGPDWQDHLARQLVGLVQQAGPPGPDVSPGHVWPGAEALAGGIGAAVEGRELPDAQAVEQAWQQALAFTGDLARLETILALLRKAGRQRLTCQSRMAADTTGGAEARLESFLCLAGLELMRAHRLAGRDDNAWTAYLQQAFAHAVQVLFAGDRHETDLGWLDETWARWGCLALWEPPDAGEPTPTMGAGLIVNSVYRWDGRTRPSLGDRFSQPDLVARLCSGWDGEPAPTPGNRYAASDFPPAEFIPGHPAEGGPPDVLLVLTIPNAWGVLLLRLPAEAASLSYGMLAPILAIALERARLVASLQEAADEYIREKDAAEAARRVAEEGNQLKTRLLANVSHELRTPLNIILGYTMVALAKPNPYGITLPAAFHDDLGHVHSSGEHLLRLINDLLDVARAEMHELHLFPEEIAPRLFLDEVFQSAAHGLSSKAGVTWRLHLPDHLPAIKADPMRLRQILFNLLSNAHKFTKSGEIVLGAEAEPPHLHLWVAD